MRFTSYVKGWKNERRWTPPPAGTIISFAASSVPNGWLACDGSSVATAAYPTLFAVVGYSYGGSGASFTLPDLRNRIAIGAGTGAGLTARSLGAIGGAATVTLNSAESGLASHAHTVTETAHTHTISETSHAHLLSFSQSAGGVPFIFGANVLRYGSTVISYVTGTTDVGFSVNSSTVGGSVSTTAATTATGHSNKQPTMTLTYLIKL